MLRRIFIHSIVAALVTFCILIPDFLFQVVTPAIKTNFGLKLAFVMYVMTWLLISCRNIFKFSILILFYILQNIVLIYIAYFGNLITVHEFGKIFAIVFAIELMHELQSHFKYVWFVPCTLTIIYTAAIFLIIKTQKYVIRLPYTFLIVLIIISWDTRRFIKHHSLNIISPNPLKHSLQNGVNRLSEYFLGKIFGNLELNIKYLPYEVSYNQPLADNSVLIFGESTRYQNMSLFGYERKTTPYLDSLKNDRNFTYKKAMANGVSTNVAAAVFLNLAQEPGNIDGINNSNANLFKIAQDQGFYTYWISSQRCSTILKIGNRYINYIQTYETLCKQTQYVTDDTIVKQLYELKLQPKNFIVLKQSNMHSPYEKNYKISCPQCAIYPEVKNDRAKTANNLYDNAMLYYDMTMQKIIEFCKNNLQGRTYVIFISDHGQALGEDNLYGHSMLIPLITKIPFFMLSIN